MPIINDTHFALYAWMIQRPCVFIIVQSILIIIPSNIIRQPIQPRQRQRQNTLWTYDSYGHNEFTEDVKSLWPNDAIWWHRSRSTLAQAVACCLTASSHSPNQCWFISNGVLWDFPDNDCTRQAQDEINLKSILLRFHSNHKGANELKVVIFKRGWTFE